MYASKLKTLKMLIVSFKHWLLLTQLGVDQNVDMRPHSTSG